MVRVKPTDMSKILEEAESKLLRIEDATTPASPMLVRKIFLPDSVLRLEFYPYTFRLNRGQLYARGKVSKPVKRARTIIRWIRRPLG